MSYLNKKSFIDNFMKILIFVFSFLFLSHGWPVTIKDKVIYEGDDRRQISDLNPYNPEDIKALEWSRSILAQIPQWRVRRVLNDSFSLETKDLATGLNLCADERFLNLPLVSSCSAFLVAPDLIMTAGHCFKDKYDCKKQSWVFDYDDSREFTSSEGIITFKMNETVYCQELLAHVVGSKADYALVKINRQVLDRKPLNLRREGKIETKEELIIVGHPLGMPKMISSNLFVRENTDPTLFKVSADTFSGNSGSPVLNLKTGLVEGILIRGEEDFIDVTELGCKKTKICYRNDCRGETVGRSTSFPLKFIPK